MKVVVLAGGISTERDVSLISGKMIYQAMKRLGHQAVLLDVFLGMERDDIDHIFESDEDFSAGIEAIHEINPDISAVKALRKDGGKCYFGPNVIKICQMADVVFLGLHGADGEGGKVQAAFDLLGIRYTGTDFVSGALAMDKCLAKELFMQNGIPTPAGFRLKKGQEPGEGQQPKFPCVVKVSSGGSSIGMVGRSGATGSSTHRVSYRQYRPLSKHLLFRATGFWCRHPYIIVSFRRSVTTVAKQRSVLLYMPMVLTPSISTTSKKRPPIRE